MERLPKSIDYSSPLATLPDGTVNYLVSCTPINNSSFSPGSTIIVDLNNVPAFLDPASLSFRYKYVAVTATCPTATTTTTLNAGIVGCPAYTPSAVSPASKSCSSIALQRGSRASMACEQTIRQHLKLDQEKRESRCGREPPWLG